MISLFSTKRYLPVRLEAFNATEARSQDALLDVLAQFSVETNPRYQPERGDTFCNIAVWDATRALGCEIPHWCGASGRPARPGAPGAVELTANGIVDWLERHGWEYGWREESPRLVQELANRGAPVVAAWRAAAGRHGHVMLVRPGLAGPGGPRVWGGGARCVADASVADAFGMLVPRYFAHA